MLEPLFTLATGKVAAVSLVILVLSFAVLYFINPKNEIRAALGDDYVATDSPAQTEGFKWYGYDTARVTNMLKWYGEKPDRRFYELHERFILRHDLFFPPFYAVPLVLILAYLHRWAGGAPRWVVLLPLAAMVFDYAENFTMLFFLRAFRANHQTPLTQMPLTLLELSRASTVAKWCLILLPFIILFVYFVASRLRPSPTSS